MSDTPHPEPQGERIAAGALFRAHAGFVAKFLLHLGVPRRDQDDLVQEVFMTVHRKGGYVVGPAQPRTWLAAIAVRIAQNSRRSQRRSEQFTARLDSALATAAGDPAQQLDARRDIERVQHALEQLPLEQRAAFILYELEGESCDSIAASWQVPVGTIYSRLHHARRTFMQLLAAGADTGAVQKVVGK